MNSDATYGNKSLVKFVSIVMSTWGNRKFLTSGTALRGSSRATSAFHETILLLRLPVVLQLRLNRLRNQRERRPPLTPPEVVLTTVRRVRFRLSLTTVIDFISDRSAAIITNQLNGQRADCSQANQSTSRTRCDGSVSVEEPLPLDELWEVPDGHAEPGRVVREVHVHEVVILHYPHRLLQPLHLLLRLPVVLQLPEENQSHLTVSYTRTVQRWKL
jgi:hypothetical protein